MTSAFHSRSHTTPNHPGSENVTLIIRCSYGNHRDREDSWNGLDSEAVRKGGWHRQWRQNRLHNDQKGRTSTNCVRGSHMGLTHWKWMQCRECLQAECKGRQWASLWGVDLSHHPWVTMKTRRGWSSGYLQRTRACSGKLPWKLLWDSPW